VNIEFATASDLPAMADLLAELFTLEADFQPDREKQLAGLKLILDNPAMGRLFVLRVDGKVTGIANALITISTAEGGYVLLLEDVFINKECRGMGFGRRLLEHVLAWAKAQGISRVTLLVDKDNASALEFYGRLGFRASAMTVLRRKPNPVP
jgi:GNAT superfamily N-acetyltransferase